MPKVLRVTTVNEHFKDGLSVDYPADPSGHLDDIVCLLWNGRNVKLTLTKDTGEAVHYELAEAEGA